MSNVCVVITMADVEYDGEYTGDVLTKVFVVCIQLHDAVTHVNGQEVPELLCRPSDDTIFFTIH